MTSILSDPTAIVILVVLVVIAGLAFIGWLTNWDNPRKDWAPPRPPSIEGKFRGKLVDSMMSAAKGRQRRRAKKHPYHPVDKA